MGAEPLYRGKTKDIHRLPDGNYRLVFKDDATGHADGTLDPGANQVVGRVGGLGAACLRMTAYLFGRIAEAGLPTHFISADLADCSMTVLPARLYGQGLEVIVRQVAAGSFVRRYGGYVAEGAPLDRLVEFTLKDDARGDPPATAETLAALGVMTEDECGRLRRLAREICGLVDRELRQRDLALADMKMEFGRCGPEDRVTLVDEISPGCMRVSRRGQPLGGMDLARLFWS